MVKNLLKKMIAFIHFTLYILIDYAKRVLIMMKWKLFGLNKNKENTDDEREKKESARGCKTKKIEMKSE